jgi:hypothetical protein
MTKKAEGKLRIQIASDVDYNHLIAEIYYSDRFVALLSQENSPDKLAIEFPDVFNRLEMVNLDWFLDAVQQAKEELLK